MLKYSLQVPVQCPTVTAILTTTTFLARQKEEMSTAKETLGRI